MLAARFPGFSEIEKYSRRSVDAMTCDERRSDQTQESYVILGPVRHRLLQPCVVAAWRHRHHTAHRPDVMLTTMCFDELVGAAGLSVPCSFGHLPPSGL